MSQWILLRDFDKDYLNLEGKWVRHAYGKSTCGILRGEKCDRRNGSVAWTVYVQQFESRRYHNKALRDNTPPRAEDTIRLTNLEHSAEDMLGSSVGAGAQKALTDEIEKYQMVVLEVDIRALDRKDLRRVSFLSEDFKHSTQWVTALVDHAGCLTNDAFTATAADYYGLPQPAVVPYVGNICTTKSAKGAKVDAYGHILRNRSHPGVYSLCGYQRTHNASVYVMAESCKAASMSALVTPRGIFTGGMPNEIRLRAAAAESGGDEREKERWKQLIPDLKVTHKGKTMVFDLKIANECPTNYNCARVAAPARREAVNKRAKKVQGQYLRRAQAIDQEECDVAPGTAGPCEDAIAGVGGVIGLCYGHYGEASDSIDDLIDWCADATAEHGWEEHGFASRTVARGHYKAMYRHEWAMNHCREKAEHLLLNIQHALPEHGMSQAAQQQAHCERRAAYARRCCSKASKNFRPSVGARARKSARGAAQVVVGR